MKILVVDDLPTTRLFIKRLLKKIGFEHIILAEDGESALNELKNTTFDLILSDWQMPHMNGLELLNSVRKNASHRNVPFIMITTETEKEKVIEAMKAGVDQYMIKPLNMDVLREKIEEVA